MMINNKKNNQPLKNLTGMIDLLSIRTSSLILLSVLSLAFITNLQLKEKNKINVLKTSQEQAEVDEVYPLKISQPIYKLTITGSGFLAKENSFLRIVLVDKNKNEYLVYEAYSLTVDSSSFSFTTACEETCLLDNVTPDYVKIDGHLASYKIDKVDYINDLQKLSGGKKLDIALERQRIKKEKDDLKITQLNKQIKVKNQKWLAAETSVSKLTYNQKKKLFSTPDGKPVEKLPNLQGFEFYKGGIFEIKSDNPTPTPSAPTPTSALPASWDWRNVHGENWETSVKNQFYNGPCGTFATIGSVESQINLYYNQHLNLDLSEQLFIDCFTATPGTDVITELLGVEDPCSLNFHKIKTIGVFDDNCDPYNPNRTWGGNCNYDYVCRDWHDRLWKINDWHNYSLINYGCSSSNYTSISSEDDLRKILIEKGPLATGVSSFRHAMVLVGYSSQSDWKLVRNCYIDDFCAFESCLPRACNSEGQEMTFCEDNVKEYSKNLTVGNLYIYKCHYGFWRLEKKEPCSLTNSCQSIRCHQNIDVGSRHCTGFNPDSIINGTESYFQEVSEYQPGYGDAYWIFKNSWGTDWGEDGYLKITLPTEIEGHEGLNPILFLSQNVIPLMPITPPTNSSFWPAGFDGQIKCVDKDNDGYCNWGISETKPNTCPSFCKLEKDCDDSNPNLGPFDENLNCRRLGGQVTPTPTIIKVFPPSVTSVPTGTKIPCDNLNPCKSGYSCKCETLPKVGETERGGCFCEKM